MDDTQRAEQMYREGLRRFEGRDLMGAIQLWRDAVRLAPENGEYNKRLGLALARNKRWHKEAETHLLVAAKKETLNAEVTNALGFIYVDAGLKKRAEAQFKRVLAYSPNNKEAMKGLGALGVDYSFMNAPKKTAPGAQTAGDSGRKLNIDPKVAIAVGFIVLIFLYIVLVYMGVL
jgi:Flp pilus assembly protein TadD